MEILIVVVGGVVLWVHGYIRGRRSAGTVEMSERDLRRALRNARR